MTKLVLSMLLLIMISDLAIKLLFSYYQRLSRPSTSTYLLKKHPLQCFSDSVNHKIHDPAFVE